MARIRYVQKAMSPDRLRVVAQAETICAEYAGQGLNLTLRQLYYQFVARGLIANDQREYKRLGDIINDARMGGLLDWDYLVDRTRNLVRLPFWDGPAHMATSAAASYRIDLWADQRRRCEVWIEKDAGIGVVEQVCEANAVPYFSCRGYTSSSELWTASQRIGGYLRAGEQVTILHVGDHDPSGLDMTRDLSERLARFLHTDWLREFRSSIPGAQVTVGAINRSIRAGFRQLGHDIADDQPPWALHRIALNRDQIERYQPPPNPAKTTDARFERYFTETGLDESWELDALDPVVLQNLIQDWIERLRDEDLWAASSLRQERQRVQLQRIGARWGDVTDHLERTSS